MEALPRGGMSVVFKACQLSLNRIVALKTLPGDLVRDAANVEQFLAEARITANLDHPNIVRVYDFGKTEEGVYYFAMHYVNGCSIASWIRRKGFISETDNRKHFYLPRHAAQPISRQNPAASQNGCRVQFSSFADMELSKIVATQFFSSKYFFGWFPCLCAKEKRGLVLDARPKIFYRFSHVSEALSLPRDEFEKAIPG